MNKVSLELDEKIDKVEGVIKELLHNQHNLVCSTKFGPHSLVILHLINNISRDIPIIWVDTGYNTRKTQLFAEHVTRTMNLNVKVFYPDDHVIRIPPALSDDDHAEFVAQVKIQPFQKALKALQTTHWISSVRAYQTTNRSTLATFTKLTNEITKVHPMLSWTEIDMEQYLARYKLPIGPETFDPTKGESFRECGLHEQQSWSA